MTATDPDCPFCKIAVGEEPARVVLATPDVVAFFPDEPATIGHTLVIPRVHVPDIWSLDTKLAHALADTTLQVAQAVRDAVKPDGLNIIQSNGEEATQSVFHLHVHVVPRYKNDPVGPIWPDETNWTEREISHARTDITARLNDGSS